MQSLEELKKQVRAFSAERDWEQFHTPKNLAMAMSVEASEVVEHFQWMTPDESRNLDEAGTSAVSLELADVLIYLVRLGDVLGIDLLDAAQRKLALNARKYPAAVVRGRSDKYTGYPLERHDDERS